MTHRASVVFATLVTFFASACTREKLGQGALTILSEGVVNNPANKSLRFDILKFGLDRFCFEMTRRGAPLKLSDDQPVLGRFFADTCQSRTLDEEGRKSFVVQYAGKGYGWTNLTGRLGFASAGLLEYDPDFQMQDGAMYIYFRPRNIDATSFSTLLVESSLARAGMAVSGLNPDQFGSNLVHGQLQRGFTVIRYGSGGETDFGLGFIPKGQKPFKPFQIENSGKLTLANDRTEVHAGQQDYVGGFEVTDEGSALYLTMNLDGTPSVDIFLVPKGVGDRMIDGYVHNAGPAGLDFTPLLDETLTTGGQWKRFVPVPPGVYYLVVDHSTRIGRSAPPSTTSDDRAAKIDYVVQVGARP
jgi:hypothetical protein